MIVATGRLLTFAKVRAKHVIRSVYVVFLQISMSVLREFSVVQMRTATVLTPVAVISVIVTWDSWTTEQSALVSEKNLSYDKLLGSTSVVSVDIDECQTGDKMCEPNSICTNTIGSFTCKCLPGYRTNESTNGTCVGKCESTYHYIHVTNPPY